ncbi:MAG: hypothetical protein JO023_26455 [Chloroflexi bacterium]|nr:hypothetical protein [Chloroflexota bacterium]
MATILQPPEAPAPRRGRPRRTALALAVPALVAVVVLLWQPLRLVLLTLALLPAMFPGAPVNPLQLAPAPEHTVTTFPYAAGEVTANVYQGVGPGPHGGVVLVLGVGPLPDVELGLRFAEALAREGVSVVVPQSSALAQDRVLPEESDAFDRSFDLLAAQPDMDRQRLGLVGLSAAGGLALVAAAQPPLRDEVRFVNVLGGYADARALLVDIASRSIDVGGQSQPWSPERLTIEVFGTALAETAPDARGQELLRAAFVDHVDVPDVAWSGVSPETEAARRLLGGGVTREAARAALSELSPAAQARLQGISPVTYLSGLRARLYLMHDTSDDFIPFTQSRQLVADAPPGTLARFTEFSIFEHVIPDRSVSWQTFLPDMWVLFWHVHAVLGEVE